MPWTPLLIVLQISRWLGFSIAHFHTKHMRLDSYSQEDEEVFDWESPGSELGIERVFYGRY